jgi:RHS repeat-associated protein
VSNTKISTLYFNKMWQITDSRAEWLQSKHIYVGESSIATKYNSEGTANTDAESTRTYYYHSDHLGSAQTVTNYAGAVHERLEYTPYGELWIDWRSDTAPEDATPFRFTGQILDPETGLYYYGARYLDPKTSRWLGVDPAMGEYVPAPGQDVSKLSGMGGVYNTINLHCYHYAGNNPVKYIDPDGRSPVDYEKRIKEIKEAGANARADYGRLATRTTVPEMGLSRDGPCHMRALGGVAESFIGPNMTPGELGQFTTTVTSGANPIVEPSPSFYVEDSGAVIEKALGILDPGNNYKVTVARPGDENYNQVKDNAVGSILRVGGHFQEGDPKGNFRWDGNSGLTNNYEGKVTETRYITIEKVPNKTSDMLDPNRY